MNNNPILLVDDDEDDQFLMGQIIEDLNIKNKLLCFSNGYDAFNYLKNTSDSPFLIFCDINMPKINGLEFRKLINENESLKIKTIPFVFLTTRANQVAVNQAFEMNIQGFFEKEASLKEVENLVKGIYNYWKKCKYPQI